MGWKLNGLIFFLAMGAFAFGSPFVGMLLLGALLLTRLAKRSRNRPGDRNAKPRVGKATYLGAVLILVSFVAFLSGGTLSPLVFGTLGVVVLFCGSGKGLPFASPVPVKDSAVLRDRLMPFRWYAVAEVKLATKDPATVLSFLDGRLVFRTGEAGRAYLVLNWTATSLRGAEKKIGDHLRLLAASLLPLGAYTLPLDGNEALGVLSCAGERVKLGDGDLGRTLAASPFDTLVMRTDGPTVETLDAYRSTGSRCRSVLNGRKVVKPVSMWEVAAAISKRCRWSEPDELLAFLSSLAATRGIGAGQQVINVGNAASETLLVRSLNTSPVELTRAQLRLLMSIYS